MLAAVIAIAAAATIIALAALALTFYLVREAAGERRRILDEARSERAEYLNRYQLSEATALTSLSTEQAKATAEIPDVPFADPLSEVDSEWAGMPESELPADPDLAVSATVLPQEQ